MKPTGNYFPSFHPKAGQEIMQVEESDIDFWETPWEQLSIHQKADYCSYKGIGFLCSANEPTVSALYYSDQMKQTNEL